MPKCFSQYLCHFIHTSNIWVIQFLCLLLAFGSVTIFYFSHSDQCIQRIRWFWFLRTSDETWSTWGRNSNPLQYSCLENPTESMKRQKYMTSEVETTPTPPTPQLEVVQCATGEVQRAITNSSRKNELAGPKWKWHSAVDVSDGESKVWWYKEQYCIGTWNVQPMNQGKLGIVKQKTEIHGSYKNQAGLSNWTTGTMNIFW